MKKLYIFFIFLLIQMLNLNQINLYSAAESDTLAPFWRLIPGPTPPDIRVMNVDSANTLWASFWGAGIGRSYNNGQSWTMVNNGLTNLYVTSIEFDSTGRIYAGTLGGGIYRSANNGLNWTRINNGLTNLNVKAIRIKKGGAMFAGTLGGGVFRSNNGGDSWVEVNNNIWNLDISCLYATVDGAILAGTVSDGIYRTTDDGNYWKRSNGGLTSRNVTCFIMNNIGELYCGTLGGGINFSVDGGVSWSDTRKSTLFKNITCLTIYKGDEVIAGTEEKGIYRYDPKIYEDWVTTPISYPGINTLARNSQGLLFAYKPNGGLYKSEDGGKNWVYVIQKIDTSISPMLAYKDGLVLASNAGGGIYRSTDNGLNWAGPALAGVRITAFGIDSMGVAYAGGISAAGSFIYSSNDKGINWFQIKSFVKDTVATSIGIRTDGTIFAGLKFPPADPKNPNSIQTNVIKTTNYGATWTTLNVYSKSPLGFLVIGINVNNQDVYLLSNDTLLKSTNNGTNWTKTLDNAMMLTSIAFGTTGANGTIFVGSANGVYRSMDNGANWTNYNMGLSYPDVKFVLMSRQNILYVGLAQEFGIKMTRNNGTTWDSAHSGYIRGRIESMTISGNGFLFLATTALYRAIEPPDLPIPSLRTPTNSAGGISINPILDWDPVEKADLYEVQISNDVSFDNIYEKITLAATERKIQRELDYNTLYFWRVRSRMAKSMSDWSQPWVFLTVVRAPVLVSPPNNEHAQEINLNLVWHKVDGAGLYTVQLSKSSDFSSFIVNKDLADTFTVVKNLELYTKYYWRVLAKSNKTNSEWSEVWNFTTKLRSPVLRLPAHNSYGHPTVVQFKWDESTGANGYEIIIAKDDKFDQVIFEGETSTLTTHQSKLLEYFTSYWWKIRARDDYGRSDWTEPFKFTTVIPAPNLVSPDDSLEDVTTSVEFTWEPYQGASYYYLQVATDRNFNNIFYQDSALTNTKQLVDGFSFYKTYFWRVRVKINNYIGLWASQRYFVTGIDSPELLLPINNSIDVPLDVVLTWKRPSGATLYNVLVAKDSNFKVVIARHDSLIGTQAPMSNLALETIYYWKVKALYDKGESKWSETWSFTTIEQTNVDETVNNNLVVKTYPVPFNNKCIIQVNLENSSLIDLTINDIVGNNVAKITSGYYPSGINEFIWEPDNLNAGIYFYHIRINEKIITGKIIKVND